MEGRTQSELCLVGRLMGLLADLSTQFERFCEMEFNDSQFTVEKT